MKKLQRDRSCNTSSIHASHLYSSRDKLMHRCDQYLTNPFMVLNPPLLQGLAIILVGSLVDPQVLVGIPLVEILLLDTTTQVVVVKAGVLMAMHNTLKDEVHHMVLVICLVLVLEAELEPVVVVVMARELQITHRMVHMLVVLVLGVAPM